MQEVRSQHWACGTEVVERVPEGFDLSEGLALVCPRCQDAWWHYPELVVETAAATAPVEQRPAAAPPPGPRAEPPPPRPEPSKPSGNGNRVEAEDDRVTTAIDADRPTQAGWPDESPRAAPPRGQPAGPTGKATDWLGPILIVAGLAVVGLRLADVGRHERPAQVPADVSTRAITPSESRTAPLAPSGPPAPVAAGRTPPPDVRPGRTIATSAPRFTLRRPGSWSAFREAGATAVAAPGGAVSVRVYVASRPDLSLEQMGRLSVATLRRTFPGARVSRPRAVRIGGRQALLVTARKGAVSRDWTAVAARSMRFIIDRRVAAGATARQRALADWTVRSFRAP